jgi:hypothetical protein
VLATDFYKQAKHESRTGHTCVTPRPYIGHRQGHSTRALQAVRVRVGVKVRVSVRACSLIIRVRILCSAAGGL